VTGLLSRGNEVMERVFICCLKKRGYGSIAEPDQGSGGFLTLRSGVGKKSRSGSGMNIPDHVSES
jgi:hypothetical protein